MTFSFNTVDGFGHLTHEDFIYNPIDFFPSPDEEHDALAWGLLPDEANSRRPQPWFASRSTRIDVAKYAPTKTVKKLSNRIVHTVVDHEELFGSIGKLNEVYLRYCQHKQFPVSYDLLTLIHANASQKRFVLYWNKEEHGIIGFVVMRQVGPDLLSLQFAWDYENPKLSLGSVSQYIEVQYARSVGAKYIYLMPGYEAGCLYKADFAGIEWYDGQQWRDDTDELKRLMLRDEQFKLTRPND